MAIKTIVTGFAKFEPWGSKFSEPQKKIQIRLGLPNLKFDPDGIQT